jgi:hypothetical protein
MTELSDMTNPSDPLRFPDGRPKSSPDDTSMLGLAAVWSELDEPLPAKGAGGRRASGGRHTSGGRHGSVGRRASRRLARKQARTIPRPVLIVLGAALALALGITAVLARLILP